MSIESNKLMNLEDAQVLYNDLRDRNEALSGDIAVKYENLTFPVAQGKHCIHDGKLYSAKQPIQNSENWNASHWDQVVLGDECNSLLNTINASQQQINSAPSEETGQALLEDEIVNTVLLIAVLDNVDYLIAHLPQEETLTGILDELQTETSWIEMIYHEVAARLEETA